MSIIKYLLKYIVKGFLYSLAFGIIGILFSVFKTWPYLKGVYTFILGGGLLTMVLSVILLVGTPQMRKSIHFDRNTTNNPHRGGEGIGPALMGITMIIIGFWVEALMH